MLFPPPHSAASRSPGAECGAKVFILGVLLSWVACPLSIGHPGDQCLVKHVINYVGCLWDASLHGGRCASIGPHPPPQFQPPLENPQAFAAGPFPCSQSSSEQGA